MAIPIAMSDGVHDRRNAALVIIRDYSFEPATLRVVAGAWVRWLNVDEAPAGVEHTGADRLFRSTVLFRGESYARQFNERGEFPYHCGIHPHMRGRVIVS